jgi:hypothetical protein
MPRGYDYTTPRQTWGNKRFSSSSFGSADSDTSFSFHEASSSSTLSSFSQELRSALPPSRDRDQAQFQVTSPTQAAPRNLAPQPSSYQYAYPSTSFQPIGEQQGKEELAYDNDGDITPMAAEPSWSTSRRFGDKTTPAGSYFDSPEGKRYKNRAKPLGNKSPSPRPMAISPRLGTPGSTSDNRSSAVYSDRSSSPTGSAADARTSMDSSTARTAWEAYQIASEKQKKEYRDFSKMNYTRSENRDRSIGRDSDWGSSGR